MSRHRRTHLWLVGVVVAATMVMGGAAWADDGPFFTTTGTIVLLGLGLLFLLVFAVVYCGGVIAVEAWVLNRFLQVGYKKTLGYSALINLASWGVSLGWEALARVLGGASGGWKTALARGEFSGLAFLFVRSLVVAIVIEGVVLLLMLGRKFEAKKIIGAVAAANGASYVVNLLVMLPFVHKG
jgi:hypothetical protein